MDSVFNQWSREGRMHSYDDLIWLPDHGMGFFPVQEQATPYDNAYFDKYRGYEKTEQGLLINRHRVQFVHNYWQGPVLDVGIGCGSFMKMYGNAQGFDINPAAIQWLFEQASYRDLYAKPRPEAITFWDSLEHIREPAKAVQQTTKWVFVCTPIYRNVGHLLESKHYRKDEHFWYWTMAGLVAWMEALGFEWIGFSAAECLLGREDIGTFAFLRREEQIG